MATACRTVLLVWSAGIVLMAGASKLSLAQENEPAMEELILADGDSGSEWVPAEATMEPDDLHSRSGRAMHFHIDVDYTTGEPNYPIGWPRTYLRVPDDCKNWTGWDFIDFWLYADTSRESFPSTPLGFIIRCPDRNSQWQTTLKELRKGEWVHFRFPLANLPNPSDCAAVQFFISESNYRDGDALDFWIDDLKLLRYAEPTIISIQPLNQVAYADLPVLRVAVELTGLQDDATAQVEVMLVRGDETVQQASAPLRAGVATIPLPLEGRAQPGEYRVIARVAGSDRTLIESVRLVSSPWEGIER